MSEEVMKKIGFLRHWCWRIK